MDLQATSQFQRAIVAVEALPLEHREDLLDVLIRRLAENRRDQIAANARDTLKDVREGNPDARYGTLEDLKKELLAGDVVKRGGGCPGKPFATSISAGCRG